MDKLLVVIFRSKQAACDAVRALHELNGQGSLRLDRLAVLTKDAAGVRWTIAVLLGPCR